MSDELQVTELFDLTPLRVLHSLHTIDIEPESVGSTVRLGFKWAEAGEGTGLFLCECAEPCTDPELCGRSLMELVQAENPARNSGGKSCPVELPWEGGDGEGPMIVTVWCCDNCDVAGTGAIYDVWVGRFFDLPARLLQYEHQESARSYTGLVKSMGHAYPDTFSEASFVTLLLYRRTT